MKAGEEVNSRYTKIGNIQLNTVVDSLKCLQSPLDNNIGPLYAVEYEIKNPNHLIMTIVQCRSLVRFERAAPQRIEAVCYNFEEAVMKKYLANPKVKVSPLKLPPQKSQEEATRIW